MRRLEQLSLWSSDTADLLRVTREANEIEHAKRTALEDAAARVLASRRGLAVVNPATLDELRAVLLELEEIGG